jgi:glycosyltransferase involved in cell wall biosynthesis
MKKNIYSRMRFHVLSLPHTITRKDYSACAFTMKVLKFCKMMTERGHTVIHYGHADSDVICTEHVPIMTAEDLRIAYGDHDWRTDFFKHNTADYAHKTYNERTIPAVRARKQKGDFLLLFWGFAHEPIKSAHPDLIALEPGIGCTNKPCCSFNVFESYSVMSAIYGKYDLQPHWYDVVIPNYFDPADFEYGDGSGDYLLFVGRIISTKGVGIAIDIATALGMRLLVAGQGDIRTIRNPLPPNVEVIGYVEPAQRSALMKGAKALLAPSHYNEPFGGVTIEALFCGTPIITSDWGGFAENNLHGVTGYRCRTMEQFIWATRQCVEGRISRKACRDWAMANFSLSRVAEMYEEYFDMLSKVYNGRGFYAENPARTELDWLTRKYPAETE